jgi:hypothetical protein
LLPEPPQLNTHESAELNTHESFRPCWCATAGTPRTDDPGVGRRLKTHVGDASCRAGRLARVARLLRPAPPAPTQPTNPPTHPHDTNTTQPSLLPEPAQLNTHESAELNTHESFRPCWCATAGTPRTDDPAP